MNKRGILVIVSGPSGAGKGTVVKELMRLRDDMFLSVSATTRGPRPGEIEGVHYRFTDRNSFLSMIERDEVLEYAEYCDNFYGTPLKEVEENLSAGRHVILEIEVQGAMKVKDRAPDAVLLFLAPPSLEELERRLRGRGTEDEETVKRRLAKSKSEYDRLGCYDYFIVNDSFERAAALISSVIDAESCAVRRIKDRVLECRP